MGGKNYKYCKKPVALGGTLTAPFRKFEEVSAISVNQRKQTTLLFVKTEHY